MPKVLTRDDAGTTFFIDLGDGTGVEGVYIVPMSDTERDKLRKRFTTKKPTRNGLVDELDSAGFYHARLKNMIKDWVGFTDIDGNEVPCTPENIVNLAEMNTALFIEILQSADNAATDARKISEKN